MRTWAWLTALESDPRWGKYVQFVKFGIVGLSNTLISQLTYWLCYYGFHWHYQVCNIVAFVVSVTNAYYWNSRYVFKSGVSFSLAQHVRAYLKAFLSYGSTFLLGTALLTVWVEACHIDAGLAPLINLIITIPLNFVLNKFWAFRKKEDSAESAKEDKP
ncbi:MAG: GtrA family protein [Eubacteriales bacterium]|nr:GtrA family protein [Eubacteriales bacterium]